VIGSISGVNNATATTDVGIGTANPIGRLDVRGDVYVGLTGLTDSPAGSNRLFVANDLGDSNNSFRFEGRLNDLNIVARSGGGSAVGTRILLKTADASGGETTRLTINSAGNVSVHTLGSAGATPICRNASLQLSTCSSSLRYKTNISTFNGSIDLVNRLKPITFDWKDGGMHDLGLGAEDVAAVEPMLLTYNEAGQVEGVKYDRISVVLINAVKEQQQQIQSQQKQIFRLAQTVDRQSAEIERQNAEIDAVKRYVCSQNSTAEFCRLNN
jgi:hypothetical protein